MILVQGSNEVPMISLLHRESLNEYSAELIATHSAPIHIAPSSFKGDKSEIKVYPMRSYQMSSNLYKTHFVSETYWNLLDKSFDPVCEETSATTLLKNHGIEAELLGREGTDGWVYGTHKLTKLLDLIEDYNVPSLGTRCIFDIMGKLRVVNLAEQLKTDTDRELSATFGDEEFNEYFTEATPGIIRVIKYTNDGITDEELVIKEMTGKGTYLFTVTDVLTQTYPERLLSNHFYHKYCTAVRIKVIDIMAPMYAGICLKFMGQKFLVETFQEDVNNHNATATLIRWPEL